MPKRQEAEAPFPWKSSGQVFKTARYLEARYYKITGIIETGHHRAKMLGLSAVTLLGAGTQGTRLAFMVGTPNFHFQPQAKSESTVVAPGEAGVPC